MSETAPINLSDLNTTSKAAAGSVMQVEHPGTGEPIEGWTITLIGTDAPEYQAAAKRQARKYLAQSVGKGRLKVDAEDVEEDALTLLVTATKGWTGIQDGGKPLECTPETVRDVYTRYPWLREQVNAFIANRANFLGNSSPNS